MSIRALAALIPLALAGAAGCASTPRTHVAEPIPSPHGTAEAATATTSEFTYVYRECKGPYTDIVPVVEEMWAYALTTGVENPVIHVVYYDDPETVDPRVARCDVGFERPEPSPDEETEPAPIAAPYRVRTVPSLEVVSLVVKGPPTTTWECYGTLARWASENGVAIDSGAPVYEKYLGGPGTPDAEFPVEIRMPIRDAEREP